VTICTCQKRCLFGAVHSNKMQLNELGEIVVEEWMRTRALRSGVSLGDFEVMPNHLHGIIIIEEGNVARESPASQRPTGDLPVRLVQISDFSEGGSSDRVNWDCDQTIQSPKGELPP
jgi:hypothetical protein